MRRFIGVHGVQLFLERFASARCMYAKRVVVSREPRGLLQKKASGKRPEVFTFLRQVRRSFSPMPSDWLDTVCAYRESAV
jgi:hypothetical protein